MSKLYLTPQAQKDIKEIPKNELIKIKRKLLLIEQRPYNGKKLVGRLTGLFSLRAWPYRIIYLINKKHEVWIVHVMHRQEGYK